MNAQRLKLLAILSMTIDHLGVVFNVLHRYKIAGVEVGNYMSDAYWQIRVIGRLAFPIFCFLIAEGCAHTKDIKKYIGRLAVFAIIAQIPYHVFISMWTGIDDIASNLLHFTQGNVLVTLTLGAMSVFFYSKLFEVKRGKLLYVVGICAAFVAVILLRGEYDLCGLLIILLVYAFRKKDDISLDSKVFGNKYIQVLCCTLVTLSYYIVMLHASIYEILGATISALPLLLYNNKPGNRTWKWVFYIYYPAHMLILSAIMYIVMI